MLRAALIILLAAYPFLVWLGLDRFGPLALGAVLAVLFLFRLGVLAGGVAKRWRLAGVLAVLLFVAGIALTGDERVLKLYPVGINLGLLVLFAASLFRPPTVIERGLRLAGRPAPDHARAYLWWVTLAWSGFFLVNGAVAAWTALAAPLSWWTLYNGLLSYLLIAGLFAAELLARGIYRRRLDAPEPSLD